jgi:sodium-dependent dicarboxylate transporter 2/3/5
VSDEPSSLRTRIRIVGLVAGPLAGAACVMAWMATWWLTEAIDISATALLPLALLPLVTFAAFPGDGVGAQAKAAIGAAAEPYASDVIFLFMGGFLLALSMQRWGLDRRIALITLRLVGTSPVNMVGGFMLATAVLSAFVSNTATAAMMLPIALSVIDLLRRGEQAGGTGPASLPDDAGRNFALCLMLGIAYGASIGGIATIIGTPPNGILVSFMAQRIAEPYRFEMSFVRWLSIGLPVAAIFLPITWLLLTRVLYPIRIKRVEGGRRLIEEQYRGLGPTRRGEWATLVVFFTLAACWITRPLLAGIDLRPGPETLRPLGGLTDAGLAMIAGLILFVIPVDLRRQRFVLDWETARKLPWGILILFGGGLSLAAAVRRHGVAEYIGSLVPSLDAIPASVRAILLVLIVTAMIVFLTELTSNTATTATLLPILAALAPGLGLHPFLLIVPATIGASCAFMMPVATPPNAIVFGFGYVTIPQMCRAGLWLNLIGIALITVLAFLVVAPAMSLG